QILEGVSMNGSYQLDAPFGDSASGQSFLSSPYFVDYNDLGHMILDRFNHYRVLQFWLGHLHAAGPPDSGVRDVAVAGYFVLRIYDNDSLLQVIPQNPGGLSAQRGLTHSPPSQ